jgi:hypothetical protein
MGREGTGQSEKINGRPREDKQGICSQNGGITGSGCLEPQ